MGNKTLENTKIYGSKLFSVSIILSFMLGQYVSFIPGVSLGDVILILACTLVLVLNKRFSIKFNQSKPLIIFWSYGLFISLLSFLLQQELTIVVLTRFIRFSFYIFLIIISANNLNKDTLIKVYKFFCIAISIYIILQVIIYNLFGILLPFKLLPLQWMDGRTYGVKEAMGWAERWYLRPSGIFVEPGYAAQFLLPGLAFSLYGWMRSDKNKVNFRTLILILIAIMLTNSSQGIFIAIIIIGIYIISLVRKRGSYLNIVKNMILMGISILGAGIFINLDFFQRSLNYVIGNKQGGGSTALRVYRGFSVFIKLPNLYKIIGIGHGNLGNFVLNNNIFTKYDSMANTMMSADYASGISQTLLYYGVLGFIFYLNFYWDLWSKTKEEFRLITITLIILSGVSSTFISVTSLLYVSLIYIGYKEKI